MLIPITVPAPSERWPIIAVPSAQFATAVVPAVKTLPVVRPMLKPPAGGNVTPVSNGSPGARTVTPGYNPLYCTPPPLENTCKGAGGEKFSQNHGVSTSVPPPVT